MKGFAKYGSWGFVLTLFAVLPVLMLAGCGDDNDDNPTTPTNHDPVVQSVTCNPTVINEGSSTTVTVTATDADGDALTYTYTPNSGGVTGTGNVVTWTLSAAGVHSVTVTVTDGNGGTATGSGSVTVNEVAQVTGISGTAVATAGVQADLRNALVRLFPNEAAFMADTPTKTTTAQGTEYAVSFSFSNLAPGTYYLDLWKDMDNDTFYSAGDFYGVYGTYQWPNPTPAAIMVVQDQVTNIGEIMLFQL